MNTLLMFGAAVVCLVIIPFAGNWYSSRERRRASAQRAIGRLGVTPIAALREGERARIRGIVAAHEPPLRSPISGAACVGYRVIIDEQTHNPDYDWPGVWAREAWASFLVTDGTGSIAVQGELKVFVPDSDGGTELPPKAYELLKEDKVRMRDLWGPRQLHFREALLEVGDRVSVVGRPSRAPAFGARGSSRDPDPPFRMRGTYDEEVVVIDDDDPAAGQTPA